MQRISILFVSLMFVSTAAWAKVWGENEPAGHWSFTTAKPVKVIVIGGSVSEFNQGYSDWIGRTCRNVEVVNVAKARYGSWGIGKRFEAQVLRNPNVNLRAAGSKYWVVIQGGLNNIWEPTKVNSDFMQLFQLIHSKGMKIVGLSLTPWGTNEDEGRTRRWKGIEAVRTQDATRLCVDWMMGRLSPSQALGRFAGGKTSWNREDLPDVSVDLYNQDRLRDRNAAPRNTAEMRRQLDADSAFQRQLQSMPPERRRAEYDRILRQAVEMPRWFLQPELKSFDHIHPNREGHRIIVDIACPQLPQEWGCDCNYISHATGRRSGSNSQPANTSRNSRGGNNGRGGSRH